MFRVPFDYLSNSLFVPGLEYISAVFMNFSSVHYARDASRVCVGEEEFFLSSSLFSLSPICLRRASWEDSYLVDPASSHMLVSKIKPCMSKYEHLYCETANGSLNQL